MKDKTDTAMDTLRSVYDDGTERIYGPMHGYTFICSDGGGEGYVGDFGFAWAAFSIEDRNLTDIVAMNFDLIRNSTKNRVALQCIIDVCSRAPAASEVVIRSSSQYAIGAASGINKRRKNVNMIHILDKSILRHRVHSIRWQPKYAHKAQAFVERCARLVSIQKLALISHPEFPTIWPGQGG